MKLLKRCFAIASLLLMSQANAATIVETFDSDLNPSVFSVDTLPGDVGTTWRSGSTSTNFDGNMHFNMYYDSNSFTLNNASYYVESFQFEEYNYESSIGNTWTWAFYDSLNNLLGTQDYVNDGDETVVHLVDLVSMGYTNVSTVQLSHIDGWVNIDNVAYQTAPVPLPAAVWLFGSALLGMFGFSRSKKS